MTAELEKTGGIKRRRGRPRRKSRNQDEGQEAELKKKEEEERKAKKTQLDLYNHAEQLKMIQQQCVIAEKQHAILQKRVNASQLHKQQTFQTIPSNLFMQQLNQQLQNMKEKEGVSETQHQQPHTSNENSATESNVSNTSKNLISSIGKIKQQSVQFFFTTKVNRVKNFY